MSPLSIPDPGRAVVLVGLLGSVALGLAGCEGGVVDPPKDLEVPDGLFISGPGAGGAAGSQPGGAKTDGRSVAYVSARPGTFADATALTLRNVTTGDPATSMIPVVEGGFDPVAVPASAGDELELAGDGLSAVVLTVPPDRPPLVVRTDPPSGRTDVAFAARPVVIFSEPIDPRTVTPASVQLIRAGTTVAATVGLIPESPFTAQLVPDMPLLPSTIYELVVTTAVRDLEGEPLAEELRVSFATEPVGPYRIVYRELVPDGLGNTSHIYVMNADGSGRKQLTDHGPVWDQDPAVSPDGSRILFTTELDGNADVYAMDASGSGLVNLTAHPALDDEAEWSPDGTKIAFTSDAGPADFAGCDRDIFLMDADGSNRVNLTRSPGAREAGPAWSPDGTKIAFYRGDPCSGPYISTHIWVMNADGSGRVDLTPRGPDHAVDPAWSPEGAKIAFWSSRLGEIFDVPYDVPDIFVMGADGSDLVALVNPIGSDLVALLNARAEPQSNLAWSPDGSWILFAAESDTGPENDLFLISHDGSSLVNLTHTVGFDEFVGSSQPWMR